MSNYTFRAALNAALFPFDYSRVQHSVLDPGLDVAPRTNPAFNGNLHSTDWNTVRVQYAENVLPTIQGLESVYIETPGAGGLTESAVSENYVQSIHPVYEKSTDSVPGRMRIVVTASGGATEFNGSSWRGITPGSWPTTQLPSFSAYVNGNSYIWKDGLLYSHRKTLNLLDETPTWPAGITAANIVGICAAGNYMIAFTKQEILWSTQTNPLDFATANLGAGRQIPTDLRGLIVTCKSIAGGFIIYTTLGAVAAYFTNIAATPFRFVGIRGCDGVLSVHAVASDEGLGQHYIFSRAGVQMVQLNQADYIMPEVTEYILRRKLSSYNNTTKLIDVTQIANSIVPGMTLVASRYLCIACMENDSDATYYPNARGFSRVIVYDTLLERYGMIRPPKGVFAMINLPNLAENTEQLTQSTFWMGLITPYAAIMRVTRGSGSLFTQMQGFVLFSRIQLRRDRAITLTEFNLNDVRTDAITSVVYGVDGPAKPTRFELATQTGNADNNSTFQCNMSAGAIEVGVYGAFDLINSDFTVQAHGVR